MARLPKPGSDDGSWGDVLNDFLRVSHNSDGSLKSSQVHLAGGIYDGISRQTATVLEACDLIVNANELQNYSAGFDLSSNAITGSINGHLTADGVSLSAGQRLAVASSSNYGPETYNGIYVVTSPGSASTKYVLTRTDDDMSIFSAVRILSGDNYTNATVYFYPLTLPLDLGSTQIASQTEKYGSHVEGVESNAFGEFSHAEGDGEANGEFSHAENFGYTSGVGSHAENAGEADGDYSHAENSARADGDYSHAEGGSFAYQNYQHSEGQDHSHQFSRLVCRQITIGAQTAALYNGAADHIYTFPDSGYTALVTVRVIARRLDVNNLASAWQAQCIASGNGSPGFRIVGDPSFAVLAQDAGASSWSLSDIELDTDGLSLNVSVNGVAGRNIGWEATVEVDEVRS
ncbi:MAG: hypothetical protein ACXWLH_02385 [Candidatus Saccharimonadales bacterium]